MNTQTERAALGAELRATFLFEDATDEQIDWLLDNTTVVVFEPGDQPLVEGEPVEALWVLLTGGWRLTRSVGGQQVVLETSTTPGEWAGWLPMLDGPSILRASITQPTRLLKIMPDSVRHMLTHGFPIVAHLMSGLYGGVQNFEALARQQEKLAALGKMAAGLAHELNNPAAAARRAAATLRDEINAMQQRALLHDDRFTTEQRDHLTQLHSQISAQIAKRSMLDSITQSDLEDAVATWLDEHAIDDGWELAPPFVSAGLGVEQLDALGAVFPQATLQRALCWIEPTITLQSLADEMESSTGRISELVRAMKSYSCMDQTGRQEVDLHKGIDDTLTILHHKLKRGIDVRRDYDPALPHIFAYGSELNQVWTNLLDNAIDAMDEQGQITIKTRRDGQFVRVEIADNGPGIPAAITDRIWEPFFTTKGVGEGTGLGLEIVRRIVTRNHGGEIRVQSQPGHTCFEVCLPIRHDG